MVSADDPKDDVLEHSNRSVFQKHKASAGLGGNLSAGPPPPGGDPPGGDPPRDDKKKIEVHKLTQCSFNI